MEIRRRVREDEINSSGIRTVAMTDMELQKKCLEAAAEYIKFMYPDLKEEKDGLILHSQLMNAVAAGYSKGYRDRQSEENK